MKNEKINEIVETASENVQENEEAPVRINRYAELLDSVFPESKIDILSGDLMVFDKDQDLWVSAFSDEIFDYLKTFAIEKDLKVARLKPFLRRYLREKRANEGKELLLDIPEWDGSDYIGSFSRRLHSSVFSHEQIDELIKEWLGRTFQRLYDSRVDNTCLIFLGKQGIGKDVFIRALTSGFNQFRIPFQYQGQQKDILDAMHSGVVVHIEEFDHITEKLPEAFLKMLITTSQTLFRSAFGKKQQRKDSRWSLIASCNRDDFLRDHTGNRRFVIIPIDKIDDVLTPDGQPMSFPDGLIDYPAVEGLKILAQAKELGKMKYMASLETKAQMKSYIDQLTPINPEKEFVDDFLGYAKLHVSNDRMVKGCYFLLASEHEASILQIARRYGFKCDWGGVKNILVRYGMDAKARTETARGIGVPPELIKPPIVHDQMTEMTAMPTVSNNGFHN